MRARLVFSRFVWRPRRTVSHRLFRTRNERNSIRNIEVNVPSLERFQKPRYVFLATPEGRHQKLPGRPWRRRGETRYEGGGCTPMGPATKSKISVTLSFPLGCEQGSHMWFSPCRREKRRVIETFKRGYSLKKIGAVFFVVLQNLCRNLRQLCVTREYSFL